MDSIELKDLGNTEFKNGNYQNAINYFTDAIEKDVDNHILYSNRSAAYLSNGKPQEALDDASKCIELEPTWAKGYGRKGAALHMLKQYEESIQSFEEGLNLESNNSYLKTGLNLVNNEKELTKNQPNFSMDFMQQLMQNEKVKEKVHDPEFVSKMMQYQSNPLSMLQDKDMMEVFGTIMQEMGNTSNNNQDQEPQIMTDDDDTDSDEDFDLDSDSENTDED